MQDFIKYLPILFVLFFFFFRMKEVSTKRIVVPGPIREKTTFRLFMFCGLVAVFGGIAEYIYRGMNCNWLMLIVGVIFACASFIIRRAAIKALGQFWSLHIEIRDNHEFVKTGPFRWMRHPTYFSMILEMASAPLMLSAFASGILTFVIFIPAMWLRLSKEEKAMVEKFGAEYEAYQNETPIIFPIKLS